MNSLSLDHRSLAAFRIYLAFLSLVDWYTEDSFWKHADAAEGGSVSIFFISSSEPITAILFLLGIWFSFCVLIGFNTKFHIFLCWFWNTSLQHRNRLALNGGDVVIRLLWFWMLFLPVAERWSVDRALRQSHRRSSQLPPAGSYFGVGTIALAVQYCCIYYYGYATKYGERWTKDYTAVEISLHNEDFTAPYSAWFGQFWSACKWLTFFVLQWEHLGMLVVLSPFYSTWCRLIGVCGYFALHLGFGAFLPGVGLFAFFPTAGIVPWLPTRFWEYLDQKLPSPRPNIEIVVQEEIWYIAFRILREFCLPSAFPIRLSQKKRQAGPVDVETATFTEDEVFVVIESFGESAVRHDGQNAWALIRRYSRVLTLLKPFECLLRPLLVTWATVDPAWQEVWPRYHRKVGLRWNKNRRPFRNLSTMLADVFCFFCAYSIIWINWHSMYKQEPKANRVLREVAGVLRLDQGWGLFAPNPGAHSGYYEIMLDLHLENGTLVEGAWDWWAGMPPRGGPPPNIVAHFKDYRWRKAFGALNRAEKGKHVATWLCEVEYYNRLYPGIGVGRPWRVNFRRTGHVYQPETHGFTPWRTKELGTTECYNPENPPAEVPPKKRKNKPREIALVPDEFENYSSDEFELTL